MVPVPDRDIVLRPAVRSGARLVEPFRGVSRPRGMWRRWAIPGLAFVAALVCFVAGVVVWGEMSRQECPRDVICGLYIPHRLHPLRAELLWGASATFAAIGVWTTWRGWRGGTGGFR